MIDEFLLQVPIFGKLSLIMVDPRHADLKKLKVKKFQNDIFHDNQKIECPKNCCFITLNIFVNFDTY